MKSLERRGSRAIVLTSSSMLVKSLPSIPALFLPRSVRRGRRLHRCKVQTFRLLLLRDLSISASVNLLHQLRHLRQHHLRLLRLRHKVKRQCHLRCGQNPQRTSLHQLERLYLFPCFQTLPHHRPPLLRPLPQQMVLHPALAFLHRLARNPALLQAPQ